MKRKRILSLLLSAIMLVGSMPALVLAQGENDEEGPVMVDQEDDIRYLGQMPEDSIFTVGQMAAGELVQFQFTPSGTGRYGFLCADGCNMSATFYDESGKVSPMDSKKEYRYEIQYLELNAGKTYVIELEAGNASLSERDVYCYICPMSETIPYGESSIFVKSKDSNTKHTFIPDVSGQYVLEFSKNDPNHYINLELYCGTELVNNVYTTGKMTAYLEAGVPYDIKITYSRANDTYSCNVVKANITRDVPTLVLGEKEVQLEPDQERSLFAFTPDNSGVYVFESKGEYDTDAILNHSGGDYGEKDNFRLGVYLEGGKTYFLQAWQMTSERITVPICVKRADQIEPGQKVSFDGMYRDQYYFEMMPEESGWYYLNTEDISHSVSVCNSRNSYPVQNEEAWYMEEGETYYLFYQHYGNDGASVEFTVDRIPSGLTVGGSTTLSAYSTNYSTHFASFTPESNGVYRFTSDHNTTYRSIYNTKESVISISMSGSLDVSVYLCGGTEYLICLKDNTSPYSPYELSVERLEDRVNAEEKNEIDFPMNTKKQYSFTPETSGYYQIYSFGKFSSAPYVYDGPVSLYGLLASEYQVFQSRIVELEAGKTYAVELGHSEQNTDGMYWCIHKVGALSSGEDIDIDMIGGYAYYTFTPSESGAYTFTSDIFQDASYACLLSRKNTENQNDGFNEIANVSKSTMRSGLSLVLEEGTTYILYVRLTTNGSSSYQMDIVKEQALEVGENTVALRNRDTIYSSFQTNGFCSFTPKKDGLYAFISHDAMADPIITIYDSNMKKIGNDDASGDRYNFSLEINLEGGKTYYIDITEGDEIDLAVEVKQLEVFEARLEGYSLSLDGSIAINLFMTLADSIADSDTAVLEYTRADGSMLYYRMDQKQKREVNGKDYYVFHLPVAPKEMTADLKVQIVDPDSGFEGNKYTITVQEYAQYILNNAYTGSDEECVKARPLVTALLNYGTAAQNYFGNKVDKPANSIVTQTDRYMGNVPTSKLPAYDRSTEVLPDGVIFEGASLSIESQTDLVFFFTNPSGAKLTFTDSTGKRLSSGNKGEYITVRVKGIPAHKLGEPVTLKVKVEGDANEYQVVYNPMTYCYNVLTRPLTAERSAELKELMKSFYFYNQEAVRYMAGMS